MSATTVFAITMGLVANGTCRIVDVRTTKAALKSTTPLETMAVLTRAA